MKSVLLLGLCVIEFIFAATLNVRAQDTSVPPDVKAFAAQYVAAFNAKDKVRLEALYFPESRACITPANHDVYDAILRMEMRDRIPPDYHLSFSTVNENNLKAAATLATYAIKPERELHIDYQYPGTNDGGQSFLALVRRNGRWMADFPCMTHPGHPGLSRQRSRSRALQGAGRRHQRTAAIATARHGPRSSGRRSRYPLPTGRWRRHENGNAGDQWIERSATLVGSGERMRTTKAKILSTQAVSSPLRDSKSQDRSSDRIVGKCRNEQI